MENTISLKFQLNKMNDGSVTIKNVTGDPNAKGFIFETSAKSIKECIYKALDYCYDSYQPFYDGYAVVRSGNRYGLINLNLDVVINPEYEHISVNEKCAVLRRDGKYFFSILEEYSYPYMIFEDDPFDYAGEIHNNMSIVLLDGKYGLVNVPYQSLVLSCEYKEIKAFALNRSITAVREDDKWAIVNKEGELLTGFIFDSVTFRESCYQNRSGFNATIGDDKFIGYEDGRYEIVEN